MKRSWQIDAQDYESEEDFREAVVKELAYAEHAGHRLGLAISAGPTRERMDSGEVITHGWYFETSSVPLLGQARPKPAPAPEPEPEPEPEVVEPEPVELDEAA